jgi:hypothetical protein
MPHINSDARSRAMAAKPTAAAVLVLLLACLGLAACGSSGSSTTTSANAAATTGGSTSTGAAGPGAGRFAALRECLQKNGVTLPKRTPGQRPPGGAGGFFPGAAGRFFRGGTGATLPNGVTRAQMESALKKCTGSFGGGLRRFDNPAYKQALVKFATCMREHGVNVPAPNTSGTGPIFNTRGLNTGSAQFRSAEATCRSDLRSSFRAGPAGPTSSSGAVGSSG